MEQATEYMALAAHCKRQARLESDPLIRETLLKKAAQYDACACASMMALEDTLRANNVCFPPLADGRLSTHCAH